MKSTVLWGLVGLNAILLFCFIGQFARPRTAEAQLSRPADYMMIPGEISGGNVEVIYLIDITNGRLGATAYDDSTKQFQTMPTIPLNAVFAAGMKQLVR